MRWKKTNTINNVSTVSYGSFGEALKAGFLLYYDKESKLNILDTKDFIPICKPIEYSSDYYIINNKIGIKNKNKIEVLDLDLCLCSVLCRTERDNISLVNSEFCRGGTSYRNPRKSINELIKTSNNKVVYTWEDNKAVISFQKNNPIFFNSGEGKLFLLDLDNNEPRWELILDSGFNGIRYIQSINNDQELVIQRYFQLGDYSLVNINILDGIINWESPNSFDHYNYDEADSKFYGLGGNTFEAIDAKTGKREKHNDIIKNLRIAPNLTYYYAGFIYFSGYKDNNIPVFGAVDVEKGELLFTQEVEIPGEKSFRKGLDRPIVIGNRLYIRDSMKTLHIYERD